MDIFYVCVEVPVPSLCPAVSRCTVVTSEAVRFAPSQVVASLQVPFPNPCSAKCQTCTELSFPVVVTQAVLDLSPLVAVLTAPRGRCLPPWGGGQTAPCANFIIGATALWPEICGQK